MKKLIITLLYLTFMLGACVPRLPSTETISAPSSPTFTPTASSEYGECAYQWANQNLPELSAEFEQAIQGLQPEAIANAYAFGEDCIHADGSRTFLAKETDFNIVLQVSDLSNEETLGDWIVKVMQGVLTIPKEKIVGPGPGRVSIIFQTGNQSQPVNFYIDQFQSLPIRLSNAEIYQSLKNLQ